MSYTAKELKFINYVKGRCREHGVKCSLRQSQYVRITPKLNCSGWFDEAVPELVVAMKKPGWIGILAHEYSHLTQWVEQIPLWQQGTESLGVMWDWLDGKDFDNIDYHINVARDLELDNEKRSINIIQRFELDVDIEDYIQKANAYVQFYNYIKQTRRWTKPGRAPYDVQRLVDAMPSKFNMNYNKLPKRIEKIFQQENI